MIRVRAGLIAFPRVGGARRCLVVGLRLTPRRPRRSRRIGVEGALGTGLAVHWRERLFAFSAHVLEMFSAICTSDAQLRAACRCELAYPRPTPRGLGLALLGNQDWGRLFRPTALRNNGDVKGLQRFTDENAICLGIRIAWTNPDEDLRFAPCFEVAPLEVSMATSEMRRVAGRLVILPGFPILPLPVLIDLNLFDECRGIDNVIEEPQEARAILFGLLQ